MRSPTPKPESNRSARLPARQFIRIPPMGLQVKAQVTHGFQRDFLLTQKQVPVFCPPPLKTL